MKAFGLDVSSALTLAEIAPDELKDPEHRFLLPQAGLLWQAALSLSGDEDIGLKLAQLQRPEDLDVLAFLLGASPTVGDGLKRFCRFYPLINDAIQVTLGVEGENVIFEHRIHVPVTLPRCVNEFPIAVHVLSHRVALGRPWAPVAVRFTHDAPDDASLHAEIFRCPVSFGAGVDAVVLPQSLMDEPLVGSDPHLGKVLERYASEMLSRLAANRPRDREDAEFLNALRHQIAIRLCDGEPRVEAVARSCGISARTLHRRLKEHGMSYRDVVDGLRLTMAKYRLEEGYLSVDEIAFMLGFSEASAFRRAFRRWTGTTPSSYRQSESASPALS